MGQNYTNKEAALGALIIKKNQKPIIKWKARS
jgi:hypothetical protein